MGWGGAWLSRWVGSWLGGVTATPVTPGPVPVDVPVKVPRRYNSRLIENRLVALRIPESVLAILQTAFAQRGLYVPRDPVASNVWVSDPEASIRGERKSRNRILVERGAIMPRNLHMAQKAYGTMSGPTLYTDLLDCSVSVHCEAGSKMACEALAGAVYLLLKAFRLPIQEDYDLFTVRPLAVSAPARQGDAPGSNWVSTVAVLIAVQEYALVAETANTLNMFAGVATAVDPAFQDRP